ncbi:hypothetical protein K501DRAFT_92103, partial [Backusella circina FSU 941]
MSELKSILKPRVENKNTVRHTTTNNNSWFSRLQSRLHQGEDDENNLVILLQKHDLKKVSFSVGNLTTEHWFCCNDSPRDEKYEQQLKEEQQQRKDNALLKQQVDMKDLASFYEHACIQREESVLEYFRNILRRNRSSTIDMTNQMLTVQQAGPISDIFTLRFGLTNLNLTNCRLNDEVFYF